MQWTRTWANFRRWQGTKQSGMLHSMGLQRVGHNWVTEWITMYSIFSHYANEYLGLITTNMRQKSPNVKCIQEWMSGWLCGCSVCMFTELCPTLCDPFDCSPPGSSVYEIFQARILEWVTISSSSWPKDWTRISCIADGFFTTEPSGELMVSLQEYNSSPKRHDSQKSRLCISMDTCSYFFHPIIVNGIKSMSSSSERNLQFIRAVDWLGYSVTIFQVCGHLKRVDVHIGCLAQSHELPQRHSKGPLRRREATPWGDI